MLSFERHGEGEPLLLVHGIGHRRQAWYPVLDHLVEHREVILIDLPGHGQSAPMVTNGRGIQAYLSDVLERMLEELGLEKAHIAGNSLGGRIALEAGANNHALSVTAISPAGFWRTRAEWEYTHRLFRTIMSASRTMEPKVEQLVRTKAGRTAMFGWLAARPTLIASDSALGDYHNMRRAEQAMLEILPQATRFENEIPSHVPVTIAWGGRDMVFPKYQATVARRQLPNATHISLPGCGHVPMSDDPALIAKVILDGSAKSVVEPPLLAVPDETGRRLPFRRRLAAAS